MMKLIATWRGAYRDYGDSVVSVVSKATKEHEDEREGGTPRLRNRLVSWRRLATNRIQFRHDDRGDGRGISAVLPGAVY